MPTADDVAVSLTELRSVREGVVEQIQTQRIVIAQMQGRKMMLDSLITTLEAALVAEPPAPVKRPARKRTTPKRNPAKK